MKLKCISTGSIGNCYLLQANNGETLILDCGISIKEIKKGLNFDIKSVSGCIASHAHLDHVKSINEIKKMRIPVFYPAKFFDEIHAGKDAKLNETFGNFKITAFQLPHNGTRNCGFLIYADNQKFLYLTDMEYCPYRFKNLKINHMLIECNYIRDMVNPDIPNFGHKLKGHCELETTKGIVSANNSDALRTVILCHMADGTCDNDRIVKEVQKVAPQANVMCAVQGTTVELKTDNCPF